MKPKGGTKCCRRLHSLGPKCLESRKRVRLGRKRFRSQRDLEALTFTESGHFYVQEGGSSRERLGARPGAGLGARQTAGLEASASATPSRPSLGHGGPEGSQRRGRSWPSRQTPSQLWEERNSLPRACAPCVPVCCRARGCRCECDRTHSALLWVWAQAASGDVGEGSCGDTSAGGQGSPRPQG